MTLEEQRRPPAVGAQVRRWRAERGLTLSALSERSRLNVGYLSQIENDKASPSLTCLSVLSEALEVPIAWFFMGEVPPPKVVLAADRPREAHEGLGRVELVDGGASRDVAIVEAVAAVGGRAGMHAHTGDEHHLILSGRWRMSQGDHVVELGPGDYLRWDGTIPHAAEVIGPDEGRMLIVTLAHS
jgi:transcriptional regulator with XRE-family HTH domain